MNPVASPSIVRAIMAGKEIKAVDIDLNFSISNNTTYRPGLNSEGQKQYMLQKGGEISTTGTVSLTILKTPDGAADSSIEYIHNALKEAMENPHPEKYNKSFVFSIQNTDQEIMCISFSGHPKEMKVITPEKEGFPEYHVEIVVFDAASFKIS